MCPLFLVVERSLMLSRRLEQLRAEVAALEAKQEGVVRSRSALSSTHSLTLPQTAEQLAEIDARDRAAKEAELRAKQMQAEAETQATAMVEQQQKEMLAKQKAFVSCSLLFEAPSLTPLIAGRVPEAHR